MIDLEATHVTVDCAPAVPSPGMRSRRIPATRVHLLIALAALAMGDAAAAGECKVMDFGANEIVPGLQGMAPVRTVVLPAKHTRADAIGATRAAGPPAAATPPRDAADAIRRAIAGRDLPAFLASLPADPDQRQRVLRSTLALDQAFKSAALAIVRQILRWQPDALAERFPNSNRIALEAVVGEWGALEYAAHQGDRIEHAPADGDYPELLRLLLKAGASPNGNLDWRPPLGVLATLAPSRSSVEAARLLIDAGADVNAPRPGAQAPLVFAAESRNGELARLMIATGRASQETLDSAFVRTPFVSGNPVAALLLQAGADINTRRSPTGDPRSFITPAQNAAAHFKTQGDRGPLELAIRYRADPNRVVHPGNDAPLMLVVPDTRFMADLLALGADPNYRNLAGDTALLLSVRSRPAAPAPLQESTAQDPAPESPQQTARYQAAVLLLDHGADPSVENGAGATALKETGPDDAALVALLMAHGGTWHLNEADLAVYRQNGTPVGRYSWALLHDRLPLASAMLVRGEPIAAEDCGVMYYAATARSADTLALLMDHHLGSYDVHDTEERSPLLAAALHGRLDAVRLLLDRKFARLDERTPRHLAVDGSVGIPIPVRVGGVDALMAAALGGQRAVVEELVRRGADPDARDFAGHSVLDYALRSANPDLVTWLTQHGARSGQ
jgi:ankyrin repeat protein